MLLCRYLVHMLLCRYLVHVLLYISGGLYRVFPYSVLPWAIIASWVSKYNTDQYTDHHITAFTYVCMLAPSHWKWDMELICMHGGNCKVSSLTYVPICNLTTYIGLRLHASRFCTCMAYTVLILNSPAVNFLFVHAQLFTYNYEAFHRVIDFKIWSV